VIESQIEEWQVKEHLKLHTLGIYHIVIRSELKYLIGAKVRSWQKCGTSQRTAGLVRCSFSMWSNLLPGFKSGSDPDPEPNRQFGTVANTTNNNNISASSLQVGVVCAFGATLPMLELCCSFTASVKVASCFP